MNRGFFYYLLPLFLFLASLLQSTAANRIQVRGVKPDLVLLLVISGTLIYGSRSGIFWAFIGGIALDLFSGGPFGASSLALIAATLVVGIGHRTLSRYNILVPIGAIMIGTLVYGVVYIVILFSLQTLSNLSTFQAANLNIIRPAPQISLWQTLFWPTVQYVILPALFYNLALMLLLIPLLNRVPESQDLSYQ
jgi:rod shape-determining protein MreD